MFSNASGYQNEQRGVKFIVATKPPPKASFDEPVLFTRNVMFGYVLLDCIQKESAFGTFRDGDGDECLEFIRGLRIFAKKIL